MSDTPTFASLLTQWSGGGPAERRGVYEHLRANPAEAAALETSIRDELNSALPWKRTIAAEAMIEVYRDEPAAASALSSVLRQGAPGEAHDSICVLQQLSPPLAGPLLVELAVHSSLVFRSQPSSFHRWASESAIRAGATAATIWLSLFDQVNAEGGYGGAEAESVLFEGVANAAPSVTCDLSAVAEAARSCFLHPVSGYAAGAALWRLTWRVNRDWLASINPDDERFNNDPELRLFLTEVLIEHLGRRPDLAPVVRGLLTRPGSEPTFQAVLGRLTNLGARGWAVLLPILGDSGVGAGTRSLVFREAARRPEVLTLAQHHAHAVVLARASELGILDELLEAALGVLTAIGAPAGSALADVLDLIVKEPDTAKMLTPVIPALAPGYPNPVAAVARTLDRLRRSNTFRHSGFAALAEVYAAMNLDGGPALAEDTSFDPRTPDSLLQLPAWRDATPEVRRRHVLTLANYLALSRAEVRSRAAELLRHYPDQMPAAWPALVATLAGHDERAVALVLPHFRQLAPVADEVAAELVALFREPNPTYAARAVIALWRLGRMPAVTNELIASVTSAADDAWGWAVLRGVVDRVFQLHGLLNDLSRIFAASPPDVAAKVHAMLNVAESREEAAISAFAPPAVSPVNWNGMYQCVGNDPEGGLLFLALMCAHGSEGFSAQKIWMIKHQRTTGGTSLADAKRIVERAMSRLTSTATAGDRRVCVRDYFPHSAELPKAITDLLEHRLSWYRWAGLELLDAWEEPARLPELLENRIWDRSPLVRARALRMHQG